MRRFMKYVGELWHCANLYRTEQYGGLEIGCYQDSYLINICKNPGITQEQLSKLIYVHKSNVARQVGSLEEKGFVVRKPDPQDRRNLLLYPTEKAEKAMSYIRSVHERWDEMLMEGMSEAEREAAIGCLRLLAENAKKVFGRESKEYAVGKTDRREDEGGSGDCKKTEASGRNRGAVTPRSGEEG